LDILSLPAPEPPPAAHFGEGDAQSSDDDAHVGEALQGIIHDMFVALPLLLPIPTTRALRLMGGGGPFFFARGFGREEAFGGAGAADGAHH